MKPTDLFVANREIITGEIHQDLILMNAETGLYHTTNPVGTRIWQLLEKPRSVHELHEKFLECYEIDAETCMRDLTTFLESLLAQDLVRILPSAQVEEQKHRQPLDPSGKGNP